MDGKVENLSTDSNSFLGLHNHHVCNRKPPDKAVTFLMAKKTTHANQENSTPLSFNVDVKFWTYVLYCYVHSKQNILCSWFLSYHSYSDFIYRVTEIQGHI